MGAVMALIAMGLAGCVPALATVGAVASGGPRAVAERTVLDEKGMLGAEMGYTAATMIGRPLAVAGVIDRDRFKELDNAGFVALGKVRDAYDASNAASFDAALAELKAATKSLNQLTGVRTDEIQP